MSANPGCGAMRDKKTYQQVARLHISALDQGFLSTLGPAFLTLMYQSIDECESSCLFTEEQEGLVIGFVSGASGMGPIYRQMLRHLFRLAVALAPALLNPLKLWRIAEILAYSREKNSDHDLPGHELISIAVAEQHRGQGHAEKLYLRLADHFHQRGVDEFQIVVGASLTAAHRFYKKMGAQPAGRIEVHQGQGSAIYLQRFYSTVRGTRKPEHGVQPRD